MPRVTASIRIRRFRQASSEGWEMDCFVTPDDKHSGELVHHGFRRISSFRDRLEPGLFAALDGLLDGMVPVAEMPKEDTKMVIGRLRDEKRSYYHFAAIDRYQPPAPEAEIWRLIDAVFRKRLQESQDK